MTVSLNHSVAIDAAPGRIYEALVTGAGLASFWTTDSHAEPEVGSVARFGFGGPTLRMRVDELKPESLVRWTCLGDFPTWPETSVRWRLKPAENSGIEVRFVHEGWSDAVTADDLANVNYTWGQVLGRLKQYAETGKPAPYFGGTG
jgi:uncharacterized protein YndB with AHSA1/START domain